MSRVERRDALLARVFEENPGITSAADLRDFANEAEEGDEALLLVCPRVAGAA